MRDMYEVMDSWGAWLLLIAVESTGNQLLLGLRGYYLTGRKNESSATMMKDYSLMVALHV